MKSYKHLMEQFLSDDNYYLAVKNATQHKSGRKRKARRAKYYKENAEALKPSIMFYAQNFINYPHTPKTIYDGIRRKQRQIIVPTMPEQIVHHMVVNILKPIFMHGMYEHSYGSIPNRGGHKAKKRIEKWITSDKKNMKYCLKLDTRKFFDSVDHDILKTKLAKIIKDPEFLHVLYEIIDVNDVGIPLGFYTSQWFANWFFQDLDHYIKEDLRASYYVRYMDDMVIFGANKRELHEMLKAIDSYLWTELGLKVKDNWQVYLFDYIDRNGNHIGRDLDFMGFRFYRDRTTLRKSIMIKASRKARKIAKKEHKTIYDCRQMLSYLGWIDCTDTYKMFKLWIKPYISFRSLRIKESYYTKSKQRRLQLCGDIQSPLLSL